MKLIISTIKYYILTKLLKKKYFYSCHTGNIIELQKKLEKRWEEDWNETWKDLLHTDGKHNVEKIQDEMHDLKSSRC